MKIIYLNFRSCTSREEDKKLTINNVLAMIVSKHPAPGTTHGFAGSLYSALTHWSNKAWKKESTQISIQKIYELTVNIALNSNQV